MRKPKLICTTGWAIVREGQLWPWSGGFVHRTRRGAIAAWTKDWQPWKKCYRHGDRVIRVAVTGAVYA